MAEVIINVESLTLNREFWRPAEWVEAEGIVSHPGFVVRCRDCKYYEEYSSEYWCIQHDIMTLKDMSNGFCAWGEKKENTNEEGNQCQLHP